MSHEMHHFSMGLWALGLAYGVSVVGSLTGLLCAQRAVAHTDPRLRWRWSWCAALSIGGVAIWLMHFIGMMGFDLPGSTVRYNLPMILISVVLPIGATAFGLWFVGAGAEEPNRIPRLLAAGAMMGLAVSAMHYTGMWAIRIRGTVEHDPAYVIVSIVIGVVASTAALWFSQSATRWILQVPAALVMGLAVVSLHYTGMAGVQVHLDPGAAAPAGLSVVQLMVPAFVAGMAVLSVAVIALAATPWRADRALDEQIARWVADEPATDPQVSPGAVSESSAATR